jgi:hypothetical protein
MQEVFEKTKEKLEIKLKLANEEKTSKAVLVMDMPEFCCVCDLVECGDEYIDHHCSPMGREIPSIGKAKRPDWCPLKPLPKKQKLTMAEPWQDAITMGWNACIEEIEK